MKIIIRRRRRRKRIIIRRRRRRRKIRKAKLQNRGRGERGTVDFKHIVLQDEMLAPLGKEVGLHSAADGAVVIQAGNTLPKSRL